jgi:hypothetical protein
MADGSAESIQQKISIARRDAEALKDRIKKKKDELADTTRKFTTSSLCTTLLTLYRSSRCCSPTHRGSSPPPDEDQAHPQGPSRKDLRHALVD